MSVSDESAGAQPLPKRRLVRLTEAQWVTARFQYESGQLGTYPDIARAYGCDEETVGKHARKHGWTKGSQMAESAQAKLQQATESALSKVGEQIAQNLGSTMQKDMTAWFEREKRLHTRDTQRRAKSRQKLVDIIVDDSDKLTPKDVAYIAKADDTYDNMKRRNLGMTDGNASGGSLSLSILTGQAAVQIVGKPA